MKKVFFLTISIFFFVTERTEANVDQNGDFQLWSTDSVTICVKEQLLVLAKTQMRWGDDGSIFYYQYADTGAYAFPSSWCTIGACYRQEFNYLIRANRDWKTVYSPYTALIFSDCFSGWRLTNRNFFMYRFIEGDFNSGYRFRSRLQLTFPKVNYFPIWLYASEELFLDQHGGFTQNRMIAGVEYTRKDRFRTAIEYMYRNIKEPSWSYQGILNIRIQLEF